MKWTELNSQFLGFVQSMQCNWTASSSALYSACNATERPVPWLCKVCVQCNWTASSLALYSVCNATERPVPWLCTVRAMQLNGQFLGFVKCVQCNWTASSLALYSVCNATEISWTALTCFRWVLFIHCVHALHATNQLNWQFPLSSLHFCLSL